MPFHTDIATQLARTGTNAVQLLRNGDLAECARLAVIAPSVQRIKVVHVTGPAALDALPTYQDCVDAFLLDSGRPDAAQPEYGGTGLVHDWTISARFVASSSRPVILAGGLDAGNVAEAIRRVRPAGVDLCSGVRTDGALDQDKLTTFVTMARAAAGR